METYAQIDKFQNVCQMLSDAICAYFRPEHPSTIINTVHACNLTIRDLESHYTKKGAIESIAFWADEIDATLSEPAFSRKKINGKLGRLHLLANSLKHADKDPEGLIGVNFQIAQQYLFVTIVNFIQLRDALLDAGVIKKTNIYDEDLSFSERTKLKLSMIFRKATLLDEIRRDNRIDPLCSLFLQWRLRYRLGPKYLDESIVDKEVCKIRAITRFRLHFAFSFAHDPESSQGKLLSVMFKYGFNRKNVPEEVIEDCRRAFIPYVENARLASQGIMNAVIADHQLDDIYFRSGYYIVDTRDPDVQYDPLSEIYHDVSTDNHLC